MLKELKKLLSECHIKSPTIAQRMYLDITDPKMLIARATEAILEGNLIFAIQLLNMARYHGLKENKT